MLARWQHSKFNIVAYIYLIVLSTLETLHWLCVYIHGFAIECTLKQTFAQ